MTAQPRLPRPAGVLQTPERGGAGAAWGEHRGHCQKKGLGAGKGIQSGSALTLPHVLMLGG